MPETEAELTGRNAYLLKFGITPIWFPKGGYDYIEQILRLTRNEMRYRGNISGLKKKANNESIPLMPKDSNPTRFISAEIRPTGLKKTWNSLKKFLGI